MAAARIPHSGCSFSAKFLEQSPAPVQRLSHVGVVAQDVCRLMQTISRFFQLHLAQKSVNRSLSIHEYLS